MTTPLNPRRVTLTFDFQRPGDAPIRPFLAAALDSLLERLSTRDHGDLPPHLTLGLTQVEADVHIAHAFLDAPMTTDPTQLRVLYRQDRDVLEVEGIAYHGTVFRGLGRLLPEGTPFRLVKREDGVLTIEDLSRPLNPPVRIDPPITCGPDTVVAMDVAVNADGTRQAAVAFADLDADDVLAHLSSIAAGVTTRRHVEYVLEACMRLKLHAPPVAPMTSPE